jgi:hypothetical protein
LNIGLGRRAPGAPSPGRRGVRRFFGQVSNKPLKTHESLPLKKAKENKKALKENKKALKES